MSKLLYIEASPRKARSWSIKVAKEFIEEYQRTHPQDTIHPIDIWSMSLPEFTGDVIDAKYVILHQLSHTEAQRQAWKSVEAVIEEFKEGDKYLFSVPMWNFNIPYKLKQYIDNLVQPGYTFSYSPTEGFKGLIQGKPIMLIYSSGGTYPIGTPSEHFDHQKKYMETILGFIGFDQFQSIVVDGTEGPEKGSILEQKKSEAHKKAANF